MIGGQAVMLFAGMAALVFITSKERHAQIVLDLVRQHHADTDRAADDSGDSIDVSARAAASNKGNVVTEV